MNNIWEFKKLGQVCTVIAGQSPEGKYYNANSDGLPFYQGKKEFKDKYIGEPTKWTTKVTKEAIAGDILMSVRAPVGPVNFATQKICIGRGLAAIRATKAIDKNYLFYYFIKHENEIVGNEGAVFNSINKTQIENLDVPLPPIPEQKRIVEILDKAFAAIDKAKANAQKNLQNSRELFESYLNRVFAPSTKLGAGAGEDLEEKKLGEIAAFRNGMNFTKASKGETIKIVGVRDFQNSFWVPFDNLESVTIDGVLKEIDFLRENDILAVRSNGNPELIGRTLLSRNIADKASHSGFTIRVRLNSDIISPEYLCHYLKTKRTRKYLVETGTGVNIKSLNQSALSSLLISFPKSLTNQQTIVKKVKALSAESKKLENIYQQKLTDFEELKKSILQKAFEGKL